MSRPIRILELRSVRGTGGGPEKTILFGAALANRRFHVTVCYLRDRRDRAFGVTDKAEQAGVDYIEVLERHSFDPSIWFALREKSGQSTYVWQVRGQQSGTGFTFHGIQGHQSKPAEISSTSRIACCTRCFRARRTTSMTQPAR